jgi:alpha-tubulin suppressor-like RCC1 family protein
MLDRGAAPGTMGAALPKVDLGQDRGALAIAAGFNTTCAVLDTHEVKCWGDNSFGKLGLGDSTPRGDKPGTMGDALAAVDLGAGAVVTAVRVGNYHACARLEDGSIRCWGDGTSSGLADGHGATPGSMGDALPAVRLGTGRTASRVFAGYNTSCALLDDNATKCWGDNEEGELGLGDLEARGDSPGSMGDALAAIDLGAHRLGVLVAPSSYSTCALLDDGSVRCWGNGPDLGLGSDANHGNVPGTMGADLPAVDLGAGRSALSVTSGARWACALLDDHGVKCWGYNSGGQLGQGDMKNRGGEPSEMGDNLPPIDLGKGRSALAIEAGDFFACAILDTREVKCWGNNANGELGLGDTETRGAAPGTMGDTLPVVALW